MTEAGRTFFYIGSSHTHTDTCRRLVPFAYPVSYYVGLSCGDGPSVVCEEVLVSLCTQSCLILHPGVRGSPFSGCVYHVWMGANGQSVCRGTL